MKYFFFVFLGVTALVLGSCANDANKRVADDATHHDYTSDDASEKKPLSPRTDAMANIGDVHIHINYSSPSVRGRIIWGGLVAYDQVWVTGAHRSTSINFSGDVRINGQIIPAGTYAFFTIPGKDQWVAILNENYEQHLADDYDQVLDVMRMNIKPETLEESIEALTYIVQPTGNKSGTISIMWDRIKVSFDVQQI